MNTFTWLWIAWGLAFCVIEGVALFNSTRGDTLSEHVWAWLGVSDQYHAAQRRLVEGDDHSLRAVTPRWTLRVARLALITFMVWLTLHFVTGGWV